MTAAEAKQFAERWLPAWTGNDPVLLAGFYSEDAYYLDPGIPGGIKGKPALLAYFKKLLANNPRWVWTQLEGIPLQDGFLNKWLANIPVGSITLQVVGVCLVQLDDGGRFDAMRCTSIGLNCLRKSRDTSIESCRHDKPLQATCADIRF